MLSILKKSLSAYTAIVLIVAALVGGFYIGKGRERVLVVNERGEPVPSGTVTLDRASAAEYLGRDVNFDIFLSVWDMLRSRYIDQPISETKLFYGALEGMVAALEDPYSVFLTPKISEEFSDSLNGRFEGIGAEIGLKHEQVTVIAPLDGSPAERAGLLAKDSILKIDGTDTQGMDLNEAVNRIRGEKGTTVVLTVAREEVDEPIEVSIVRDTIRVKSVSWEMKDGGIAYIKMRNFNTDTTDLFRAIAREALAQNPKGIVFDLRNNSGGFLQTAVDVASAWIEDDAIVIERTTSAEDAGLLPVVDSPTGVGSEPPESAGSAERLYERAYQSNGRALFAGIPTVLLVNGGSASASEIVAGALQDYGAARLIGEQTYGKGSVQILEELPDGSSVKFTVARWYTPKDRSIDEEGITPDEVIELSTEDFGEDKDPQLERALEHFKNNQS
ncbi:MAG: S41 family peptidase [Parcubacteria group bacterium]|nr:S41 family peptidase [Parcubacteria group bacterium]